VVPNRYQKRYLTGPQVRRRYGNKSHVWLWRQIKFNPDFPKPIDINGRHHFDENEMDAYDEACRAATPAVKAVELEETVSA
jgi:predicted DNA-binding transcriptional regulator AlpA